MQSTLEIRPDGIAVLKFSGQLDVEAAASARERLNKAIAQGIRRLVVDLSDVSYMDDAGLNAITGGLRTARLAGGDMRLACPGEHLTAVFESANLHRVLNIHPTIDEAAASY